MGLAGSWALLLIGGGPSWVEIDPSMLDEGSHSSLPSSQAFYFDEHASAWYSHICCFHTLQVEVLEYPELGMEAIWKIDVENFPAFIVVDSKGEDFFAKLI